MFSGFTVKDRDSGVICSKEQCCLSVDKCSSAGCVLDLWTVIGTTSQSKGFSSGGAVKDQSRDIQMIVIQ